MRAARRTTALLPLLLALPGCPAGDDASHDADDAEADDAGDAEADASFPDPPALTPCPEGWAEYDDPRAGFPICEPWPAGPPAVLASCPHDWRESVDPETGTAVCEPWPEGGPADCPAGEVHFPGEPGCRRVGSACPAGDWPDDLPADGVLYVRADAAPGGDGTRDAPLATIAEALAVTAPGDIVVVAAGSYDEAVALPGGVELRGACALGTRLAPSTGGSGAALAASGTGSAVRDLAIGGERIGIVVDGAEASLRISGVRIEGTTAIGLYAAHGAAVDAEDLVIRDTRTSPGDGSLGTGLLALDGALTALRTAVVSGNGEFGIDAANAGTTVLLQDVAVTDTRGRTDGTAGNGIHLQEGAQLTAARLVVERSLQAGIAAGLGGTSVALSDAVIRDTEPAAGDGADGTGLAAFGGAVVEADRLLVERTVGAGIDAVDSGTALALRGLVVRDTASRGGTRDGGTGLLVLDGATAEVTGAVFERNRELAIGAGVGGALLTLREAVVRDTLPRERDGTFGRGLNVEGPATVEVERVLFVGNRDVAVLAAGDGAALTLTDVVVRDTESEQSSGSFGRALAAMMGAAVEARRVRFERNREVAVYAAGAETTLALEDAVIRGTLERACVAEGCAGYGAGIGLGSYGGASVDVTRFLIADDLLCGVQLARGTDESGAELPAGGEIDLREGTILGHPVAVNVQTEGFAFARLMDRVLYVDNVRNLDSDDLPVPEAAATRPE